MVVNKLDLSSLQDDGDTLELDDGRTLRLRIEQDPDASIDDSDNYGKIASVERDRPRPDGFDGNAEKLSEGQGYQVWWQPDPNGPKRGTPEFDRERKLIVKLLTYGFDGVILEVLKGTDAYKRPIVRKAASLWGIDSLADGYLAEVVSQLADELEIERG